jgi:hypothetical protein
MSGSVSCHSILDYECPNDIYDSISPYVWMPARAGKNIGLAKINVRDPILNLWNVL